MPNSTWDLASVLASANDGVADTAATHATRTATGIFIGGPCPLYRTPEQATCHGWAGKTQRIPAIVIGQIYETRSIASSFCPSRSAAAVAIMSAGRSSPAPFPEVRS